MDTRTQVRVRLVIVDAGQVALIRRCRGGHTYYVLPGGGIEPGETVEAAAHREAMEELGVEIALGELMAEERRRDQRFVYHRATIVGGEFGTGTWPDFAALPPSEQAALGTHEPLWLPVGELDGLDVAAPLAALLAGRPIVRMDRLDHLVLTVADIDRARAFYSRVLGLTPAISAHGRVSLHFGHQKLNLHQSGREFEPKATRPTAGSGDLCFVTSVPMEALLEHLGREDVDVELGPVRRTGALGPMTSVYLRDPDGNLVEVASYGGDDSPVL